MQCPFCAAGLDAGPETSHGEGETGGYASTLELRCAACGAEVRRVRIDKVLRGDEHWLIVHLPRPDHVSEPGGVVWSCPDCRGEVFAAIPQDANPKPPATHEDHSSALVVHCELACTSCTARFSRWRASTFDTAGVLVGQDQWLRSSSSARVALACPPLRRR
jgi:hypothetical protein